MLPKFKKKPVRPVKLCNVDVEFKQAYVCMKLLKIKWFSLKDQL